MSVKKKAAQEVVSLMLNREQVKELRSNPSLVSFLSGESAAESSAIGEKGENEESVLIKFEFEAIPPLRLLKAAEVIHMLRISTSYLKKAVKQGDLTSYKFGRLRRFKLDDVLDYLENHQEVIDEHQHVPQQRIRKNKTV